MPAKLRDANEQQLQGIAKGLAHEIAHLWWREAPVTTWEDWLNESFAEYSSWMYVGATQGTNAFQMLVNEASADVPGTPSIWGIDRNDRAAYTVLYHKGALLLYQLEQKIGSQSFSEFLQRLHRDRVKSTTDTLKVLQELTSEEIRAWFEGGLKE